MGGSFENEELTTIYNRQPSYSDIQTFVETGTYLGQTSRRMSKLFKNVYTIEINPVLFQRARSIGHVENIDNIFYFFGDSLKILGKFSNTSCVYFLDAHQSGSDTSNNGIYVPLMKELDILNQNKNKKLIIIDDVRLFDKYDDWKGISVETILSKIENVKDYFVHNDRMIVYV